MVPTMFPPPKVFLCSDTDYLKLQHTIYIHVYICTPMNVSKYVYEQYDTEDDKVMHHSIRVILNEAQENSEAPVSEPKEDEKTKKD